MKMQRLMVVTAAAAFGLITAVAAQTKPDHAPAATMGKGMAPGAKTMTSGMKVSAPKKSVTPAVSAKPLHNTSAAKSSETTAIGVKKHRRHHKATGASAATPTPKSAG